MSVWLDGVPQSPRWKLNDMPGNNATSYWKNGIMMILQVIPCSSGAWAGGEKCSMNTENRPMYVDYVRAYKEVPN